MTKQETLDRAKFTRIIMEEAATGSDWASAARLLLRHAKTYARLQEMNCNGVGTWHGESNESFSKRQERFERALEKKEQQIKKRIRAIASGLGFGVIFSGDPRGATVKITVPSGRTDDWGHEGICVP
jgi:uncharacterized protein YukE